MLPLFVPTKFLLQWIIPTYSRDPYISYSWSVAQLLLLLVPYILNLKLYFRLSKLSYSFKQYLHPLSMKAFFHSKVERHYKKCLNDGEVGYIRNFQGTPFFHYTRIATSLSCERSIRGNSSPKWNLLHLLRQTSKTVLKVYALTRK